MMDRSKYPTDWPAISKRIRERERQRCKWCNAPNGEVVVRSKDGAEYMTFDGSTFLRFSAVDGESLGTVDMYRSDEDAKFKAGGVKIVLTVAHVDHDTSHNADNNLAALCQRCHLNHDREQHESSRRRNRRAKLAVGELPGISPEDDKPAPAAK